MALKDAIDKIVSYFDTDEVTDYEDAAKEEAKERPVKAQRPVQTPPPRQQRQPERYQATVPPRRQSSKTASDFHTAVFKMLPRFRTRSPDRCPQTAKCSRTALLVQRRKG